MKKYLILGLLTLTFLLSVGVVLAAKPDLATRTEVGPSGGATVVIPAHAIAVTPNIFYLGETIAEGESVEGYAFVDYQEGFGKPSGCNYNGKCQGWEDPSCPDCEGSGGGGEDKCYGFLARGAKWKNIESYLVNPSNTEGLDEWFVANNLANNIDKWETAAGTNLIWPGSSTYMTLEADFYSPDSLNEVYFGDIEQSGAIAITVVWGVFNGPPGQRKLVEWDQVYDQVDYDWSVDCLIEDCTSKMDFENIATHELGHSVGLDDLYEDRCSEQTMYGYADYGETKKRTFETGDITGIQELY